MTEQDDIAEDEGHEKRQRAKGTVDAYFVRIHLAVEERVEDQRADEGPEDESDHDKVDLVGPCSELPKTAHGRFQAEHRGEKSCSKKGVAGSRQLRIHEETEQHEDRGHIGRGG